MGMEKEHLVVISNPRNMSEVPDGSVQLVIASPPYFDMNDERQPEYFGDYLKEMQLVFNECYRVLQAGRHICVNVCDVIGKGCAHPYPAHYVLLLQRVGFEYRDDIIWQKPAYGSPNNVLGHILIMRKGRADFRKIGQSERKQAIFDIRTAMRGWDSGSSQLPCAISETLIKLYTCEGETVLDPFLGDGMTATAAARLGRCSISYEPDLSRLPSILQRSGIAPDKVKIIEQRRLFQ